MKLKDYFLFSIITNKIQILLQEIPKEMQNKWTSKFYQINKDILVYEDRFTALVIIGWYEPQNLSLNKIVIWPK